jgi:hypothetical protein
MHKIIILVLFIASNGCLFSQEIKFDKSNIFFPLGLADDSVTVYNTGSLQLLIDSIYSKSDYLSYRLSVLFKDTTIYDFIVGPRYFYTSIKSQDSVRFVIGRPVCGICKVDTDFHDTIIIHSNSLSSHYSEILVGGDGSTFVSENSSALYDYELSQNYPNPFNPITSIPFTLAHDAIVSISIFNDLGQRICILFTGKLEAGNYIKRWDATEFPSGIYFYKLESSQFTTTRKMILLK